jgi:hypothetical protein
MIRCLFLIALTCLPVTFATTFETLTLDAMVSEAQLAFFGEVTEVQVEARDGDPWTLVTFTILTPLSGLDDDETVTLAFYGGTLPDGTSVSVNQMPNFTSGERVLILAYDEDYYSAVVGFNQGLWRELALGLTNERGQILSLDDEGNLLEDGAGASTQDILAQLSERFGSQP